MKHFLLFCTIFLLASISICAQTDKHGLVVKDNVAIKQGTEVYVHGNIRVDSCNIKNEGELILTDTLFNTVDSLFIDSSNPMLSNEEDDEDQSPRGTITFTQKDTKKYISASSESPIFFCNLSVEKDTLTIDTSITVLELLTLDNGNINLNANHISLYDLNKEINIKTGRIKKGTETTDAKIYDKGTGTIKAFKPTKEGDYHSFGNLGYNFDTDKSDDNPFYLTRSHQSDSSVTEGSIKRKYLLKITDSSSFGGLKDITISFFDSDTLHNNKTDTNYRMYFQHKNKPARYKYIGGNWKNHPNTPNTVTSENVNLKPGYYTVADSGCENPPATGIKNDTTLCLDDKVDKFLYDDHNMNENHNYTWTSPDILYKKDGDSLKISSDTLKEYKGETLTFHLEVEDTRGCINRDTLQLAIRAKPRIGVNVTSPGNYCAGDTIFYNDTLDTGAKYQNKDGDFGWTFDNKRGTPHIYRNDSSHTYYKYDNEHEEVTVSITKKDSDGCFADTNVTETIHPLPEPAFEAKENTCDQTLSLTNNSNVVDNGTISYSILNYRWAIGNGDTINVNQSKVTPNATHYFSTDTIAKEAPTPDLTYRYDRAGTYPVSLYAETDAACSYEIRDTVQIYDSVYASIADSFTDSLCLGNTSRFTAGSETSNRSLIDYYEWHLADDTIITKSSPDDTVRHRFENAGAKTVKLIVVSKNGCTDTAKTETEILRVPESRFTVEPVCNTDSSLFSPEKSEGDIEELTWTIDDNSFTKSNKKPVHHSFSSGIHPVTLKVTNTYGCSDTFTDSAFVAPNPDASFETADACMNEQSRDTIVLNTSENRADTIGYATGTTYKWDFGDGTNRDSTQEPFKTYEESGKYNISLRSNTGYIYQNTNFTCSNRYNDSVTIYPVVGADFSIDTKEICPGSEVTLKAKKTEAKHYEWRVDREILQDNSSLMEHQFTGEDEIHEIALTTETKNGCRDTSTTKKITVHPAPTAAFQSDSVCLGGTLHFEAQTEDNSGTENYSWETTDGKSFGASPTASLTPNNTGLHEIILSVESTDGCTARDTGKAKIHPIPEIELSDFTTCSDTATLNAGKPGFNYLWSNGSTTRKNTITQDGTYSVTVTDSAHGCQASKSATVELNGKLEVNLGEDTSACGPITLDAGYFGENAVYSWNTGKQNRYLEEIEESGTYFVTVYETGAGSDTICSASDSIEVTINNKPEWPINQNEFETCVSDTVSIDIKDSVDTGNANSGDYIYTWRNTKNSNKIKTPEINATSPVAQTKTYEATIENASGCITSEQVHIAFHPQPDVDPGMDKAVCQNKSVVLDARTTDAESYRWNTGDTSATITPKIQSSDKTEYRNYHVLIENQHGCTARDTAGVTFYPTPRVSLAEEYSACANEELILNPETSHADSFKWNTGSTDSVLHVSSGNNKEVYYVTVTSRNNCSATSDYAYVDFKDPPTAVIPDSIEGCNEVELDAANPGATYKWNNGYTSRERTIYESGTYTVDIKNRAGCSITDTAHATVNHVIKPNLGADIPLCPNESKVLRTGIHSDQYRFEWNGYSTSDTMRISSGGTYRVKAIHKNGCTARDTIEVHGKSLPDVDLGPDMYRCSQDNIILDAGDDGSFYEWDSSRDTSTYSRMLTVSDTGKYWVTVTTKDGCMTSDTINVQPTSHSIKPHFITDSKLISGDKVKFIDLSEPEPTSWLWEFGDMSESRVQNPTHTYYGNNEYRVVLHVSNDYCSASLAKTIEVQPKLKSQDSTAKKEDKIDNGYIEISEVSIYPNPNNGNFTIEGEITNRSDVRVYIFDMQGKLKSLKKFSQVKNFNKRVHIKGYQPGMYIIKILAGTDHKSYKIIKR